VPDPAARILARAGGGRIGLLYANPSSAYLAELLSGALDGARSVGLLLLIEPSRPGAPDEEREAATEYTNRVSSWFQSKGVDVPNRGVLDRTGKGQSVSRFHTEPFFAADEDARQVIIDDALEAIETAEALAGAIQVINSLPQGALYEIIVTASFVLDRTLTVSNRVALTGQPAGPCVGTHRARRSARP
jgi:hypothetical protein